MIILHILQKSCKREQKKREGRKLEERKKE
jgi:hypothetical protein